jgi:ATP-binding cassette subfamily F protein 3
VITFRNISIRRGSKLLLDKANAAFMPGARVGVVGANGCGKSTLFAALAGEIHTDGGDIEMPPRLALARVFQETDASPRPALEYVLDGDAEYREAEAEIAASEASDDGERIAHAHERFNEIDGWAAPSRAAAVMDGLGFNAGDINRPVAEFSGGWRMRLNLAHALIRRSDLLLLDEPTNHLDLDAVLWLERWLAGYRGTLFLISHDRELLDGVVTEILHFDHGALKQYTGNYDDFESARAMALSQQAAAYASQQRRIAHLQSFVDRFRAKATKARQAQSRIKALERMERIAPAHVDSPFSFSFRESAGGPDPVIALDGCAAAYGDHVILDNVTLSIRQGERIGLLGRNGAGKSTLIQLINGTLAPRGGPEGGSRVEGKGMVIGYFAQHQLESLDPAASPLLHLQRIAPRTRDQELRDYLGGFNFVGDMALAPIERFSGGEKARLALALLIWLRPNLLLLDEPTNHLDIDMREALTEALQEYQGALVLVSHDRHLLRTTCDEFLLIADGRVAEYDGDLDDYRQSLAGRKPGKAPEPAAAPVAPKPELSRKDERKGGDSRQRESAGSRPRGDAPRNNGAGRKSLEKRSGALEKDISTLTEQLKKIDAQLASADFYGDGQGDAVHKALAERTKVAQALEAREAEWMGLLEELEKSA